MSKSDDQQQPPELSQILSMLDQHSPALSYEYSTLCQDGIVAQEGGGGGAMLSPSESVPNSLEERNDRNTDDGKHLRYRYQVRSKFPFWRDCLS
jgi:hypothetical protein